MSPLHAVASREFSIDTVCHWYFQFTIFYSVLSFGLHQFTCRALIVRLMTVTAMTYSLRLWT